MASASASPSKEKRRKRPGSSLSQASPAKKSSHSLNLRNIEAFDPVNDSGSDDEHDAVNEEANDKNNDVDYITLRQLTRRMRNYVVEDSEKQVPILQNAGCKQKREIENVMNEKNYSVNVDGESNVNERGCGSEGEAQTSTADPPVDINFSWSEDFSSFTGQKEVYLREPGPTFSSHDPGDIFLRIWDHNIMEMIVRETNRYAWEVISKYLDPNTGTGILGYLEQWKDVTVEEMYTYFAMLILLSLCHRSRFSDYWSMGILDMPKLRKIMSRNKCLLIGKFLHFISNADIPTKGHERKIAKIAPIIEHCNRKFAELYIPFQHLSLDESLLLWKGALSWKQCVRSKAARFGIKSFELCESTTGYLLQYRLYTGKSDTHDEPLHGFQDHTAKIVLDLMEKYLDVGHVLVMDNWYNQLPLTRYLKTRRTDVLGTLNRRRQGVPQDIKDLIPKEMGRRKTVGRHSGDIALVAWNDLKLVTLISTYHQHVIVRGSRAGKVILKPSSVQDYNRYMGGVDLKDQKLSMYCMERKRNSKWYMKVFKRLLNTSILNAYIIYTRNPTFRLYSHREFRYKVAEALLSRYLSSEPCRIPTESIPTQLRSPRLQPGNHFPIYTEPSSGSQKGFKRLRCVWCYSLGRRVTVRTVCEMCKKALCLGPCWNNYHTVPVIKK